MNAVDLSRIKLGRKRSVHDRRTLMLSRYLTAPLAPPPAASDFTPKVTTQWGMLLNDQIGDCVIAAAGHIEMVHSFNIGQSFVPSDHSIMVDYEQVGGYSPLNPATDQGCDPLTALKFWRNTGISGHTIDGFAAFNAAYEPRYMQAIFLFESAFLGLSLPLAAQQFQDGKPWDIPAGQDATGDWEPYSWGGHMVMAPKYDAQYCYVVTWGKLVPVSWRFMLTYCDEAYAVWSKDMLDALGKTPSGLDVATMQADLAEIDNS